MNTLPRNKEEAFTHGVIKRSEGYNEYFNPFRNLNDSILHEEWLKGWTVQNILMT